MKEFIPSSIYALIFQRLKVVNLVHIEACRLKDLLNLRTFLYFIFFAKINRSYYLLLNYNNSSDLFLIFLFLTKMGRICLLSKKEVLLQQICQPIYPHKECLIWFQVPCNLEFQELISIFLFHLFHAKDQKIQNL